jgi:hypothetical protein
LVLHGPQRNLTDVQWHVTKPLLDNGAPNVPRPAEKYFPTGRLDTPFFCHDVTERALLVPFADKDISKTHPRGARGILSVELRECLTNRTCRLTTETPYDTRHHGYTKSQPCEALLKRLIGVANARNSLIPSI